MNRESLPAGGDRGALAEQRRLVTRLCDGGVFPHAVGRLALIETHISFVILTGPFAYKIKKAVDLGFLDYTALDRRRFYCEEELRLNRRLAAPLYLDVVTIGGTPDAPRLGDGLSVLEYAVRMHEFEQECLLDRVLGRGDLRPDEIDALALRIAEFHRQAPVAGTASDHGSAAFIERAMLDNFSVLRGMPELANAGALAHLPPDLGRIEAWSRRRFAELQPVFEARRQDGFVRECHGDLHLGNMVRLDDGLHVFDGIEFSEALRWIDVVSEIAFLVMDLSSRGRSDYAYRFLNAYLEHSGDYAGLAVLPFYVVYRALVRAKVSGIRAAQASASPVDRAAALAAGRSYLALAARLIDPAPAGLVITHGFSGAGKTFVAGKLVETLPAIRIRSDVERKRLYGLAPLAPSDSALGGGIYSEVANLATYRRLQQLAQTILQAGFSVVVDAAFLQRRQRALFRELAASMSVPMRIVDCGAPVKVLVERIGRRQRAAADASEASAEVLRRQMATSEALSGSETALVVPATAIVEGEPATQLRRRLFGRPSAGPA